MSEDAPIFDPAAFRLTVQEAELTTLARRLGQNKFAARAATFDREARFPTENYHDLREAGLLGNQAIVHHELRAAADRDRSFFSLERNGQ